MSKRKKEVAPTPPQRTRAWWPTAGAALVVLAAAVGSWVVLRNRQVEFPALPPAAPEPAVTSADFVGAETCRPCHTAIYDAWKQSTHGRAGAPPTPARVIAPFNGKPMRFRDAVVTPSVTTSGSFLFTVAQESRPPREFRVDAVDVGGFMAGA